MSDDIIDTIAEAIEDAERSCGPREYQQSATHVLAVLRERYTIVERDIAETHDPSGMDEYHPDSSWNPGGNP